MTFVGNASSVRLKRSTLAWLTAASFVVTGLTFIPYAMLDRSAPTGMVFSGMSTNIPDEASYLMWARQHASGNILAYNKMTTQPHQPVLPNPAWLFTGAVSGTAGIETISAYHVVRSLFALIYLILLGIFLFSTMPSRGSAWFAWVVVAVGGGLGWTDLIGAKVPSADWITELWSWPSILHYPHFALSLCLMSGFFLLWVRAAAGRSLATYIAAGLVLALLALVHPYTAGTIMVSAMLFGVFMAARRNPSVHSRKGFLLMMLCATPGFAALAIQTATNPIMAKWAAQNIMASPPLWEYMAGFGIPGLLAVIMIWRIIFRRFPIGPVPLFAAIWIGTALVLAYADPVVPFARRCVEGVHAAVVVLATHAIISMPRKWSVATAAAVLLTIAPSVPATIGREVRPDNPGYVNNDTAMMLDAIRTHVGSGNVFSDARTSLFIAAGTDASVFVGHHELSPDFVNSMKAVDRFMNPGATTQERVTILKDARCDWLVIHPLLADRYLRPAGWLDGSRNTGFKEYRRGSSWVLIGRE